MRALVHDPDAPHGLRLGEAPDPVPGPSDAIVQVAATSLNFGEVAFLRERVAPGAVAGWDASGTVVVAAADGSGPPAGARVATFGSSGAWAQQRAASTAELAVLPDGCRVRRRGRPSSRGSDRIARAPAASVRWWGAEC